MELQMGDLCPCRPHTWQQMQIKCAHDLYAHAWVSLARHVAFHPWLSSHSDLSGCRWYKHLMNHSYFDYNKNPNTLLNWSPMLVKMVMMSGTRGSTHLEKGYGDLQPLRPPFHGLSAVPRDPHFSMFQFFKTPLKTKITTFYQICHSRT